MRANTPVLTAAPVSPGLVEIKFDFGDNPKNKIEMICDERDAREWILEMSEAIEQLKQILPENQDKS